MAVKVQEGRSSHVTQAELRRRQKAGPPLRVATLQIVNGKSLGPGGKAWPGLVRAILSQATTITGTSEIVPRSVETRMAPDGTWSLSLYSNTDLTPSGTYYTFTEQFDDGTSSTYTVQVPNVGGPFQVTNIMTGVPPTASPTPGHLSTLQVDGAVTFSAGPVAMPQASLPQSDIAGIWRLLAILARDYPREAGIPVLMPNPPVISVSAGGAATGIPNSVPYTMVSGSVVRSDIATPMGAPVGTDSQFHNTAQLGAPWYAPATWAAWETYTDAPDLEWGVMGFSSLFRYSINGQLVTAQGQAGIGSNGQQYRIRCTSGSRAWRRHRLELMGGSSMRLNLIQALQTDTLLAAPRRGPRVILMADSFPANAGAIDYSTSFSQILSYLLGWDIWPNSIGGSGYTVAGSGAAATAHLADVTAFNPDIVMWFYGLNDNPSSAAAIQAAATTCFSTVAAALPLVPQIVLGPTADPAINFTGAGAATWAGIRNAIQAAAAGFVQCLFADPYGTGFLRGTGHVGGAIGDGNADLLVHTDGVHPSQAGHDALARVCATVISAALGA